MNMVSWFYVTTRQMLILYNGTRMTRIELINTDFPRSHALRPVLVQPTFSGVTRDSWRSALIFIHKLSCPQSVVIPAWMPVSSAMDGNLATLQILSNTKFHVPVPGFRHPCQNDGVSQALVYNDERSAWERDNLFSILFYPR
jgi:hypothetical protein